MANDMPPRGPIVYPDSDGQRIGDNTRQIDWIFLLSNNLSAMYRGRPDVFVAGALLWYPVEGEPTIRAAVDVLVAFGRPKGDRGSYKQWEEGGVPVTVAFEVTSLEDNAQEMNDKRMFYEKHGVEELYVYDPDATPPRLEVFLREGDVFRREPNVEGFVSPRLGVRFEPSAGPQMAVYRPNGERFISFVELAALMGLTRRQHDESKRTDETIRRVTRLTELRRKARLGQASTDELAELGQLEDSFSASPEA
jgi:Uma2 family endonuclease